MGAWLLPSRPEGGDGGGERSPSPSARDQQKAGVAGLYAVFSLLSVLAVVFIYFAVRETMGKSLEELEEGGGRGGGGVEGDGVALGLAEVQDGDEGATFGLLEGSDRGGGNGDDGEDACRVML